MLKLKNDAYSCGRAEAQLDIVYGLMPECLWLNCVKKNYRKIFIFSIAFLSRDDCVKTIMEHKETVKH